MSDTCKQMSRDHFIQMVNSTSCYVCGKARCLSWKPFQPAARCHFFSIAFLYDTAQSPFGTRFMVKTRLKFRIQGNSPLVTLHTTLSTVFHRCCVSRHQWRLKRRNPNVHCGDGAVVFLRQPAYQRLENVLLAPLCLSCASPSTYETEGLNKNAADL